MKSPRLQELARLREVSEKEKWEQNQKKEIAEKNRLAYAKRKLEKQRLAATSPLRRSDRLTPKVQCQANASSQPNAAVTFVIPSQSPIEYDCDASRKRKGKSMESQRLTPQAQFPSQSPVELDQQVQDRKRKVKCIPHGNRVCIFSNYYCLFCS
ncbi:hypothetical protein MKW94_006715 [Papaver nudicaule]|uniref:Uncharacterized protein n=1 Tax=Papaver nudicaule TaxID=74823 RepID=A0AA41VDI1_PAPNU|nr:hypothetical protein [Papaver nudicaule]